MFFLFKQKTAYEMRISDWSSDVCSSDLAVGIDGGTAQALLAELQLTDALCVAGYNSSRGATLAGDPAAMATVEAVLAERQVFYKRLDLDYACHRAALESGRAACRGRVGQYV